MSDQLSRFRREAVARPSSPAKESAGKRIYEAFDTTGKPSPYTEIRCIMQPSQSLQGRFLTAVIFSADFDNAFTLLYSFIAVEVKGRNLREVRRAIQSGRCEFIQEYHENEFQEANKTTPIIETIKFITGERLDDILASHKAER